MYNNNFFSDNFEFVDPSLLSTDLSYYIPQFEPFPEITQDLINCSEYEGIESQVFQLFDQAFQNYTKEIIKFIPNDQNFGYENMKPLEKIKIPYRSDAKIGTITAEEYVLIRFLEGIK